MWIFTLANGAVNMGFGLQFKSDGTNKKEVNLRETLLKIIEEEPLIRNGFKNIRFLYEVRGFGLPMFDGKRQVSAERVLLVDDAASLIYPF